MTAIFGALVLIGSAIALMRVFGLGPRALQAVRTSRRALEVMRDPACGDERKAALLQGYSLALLRAFADLLVRGVGAIAIPLGLLWTLACTGLLSLEAVMALTRSWTFLLGGGLAAVAACWLFER